ncbi:MAG TPA: hypothetical protein VLA13_05525 [Massilibacterium sp.]|nr:hypothetical protein [Massilibacterium sp.]
MKTIDYILEETILKHGYKTVHIGRPYKVLNKQFVHEQEVELMKKMIKEYARIKCKEQREIIAKKLPDNCFIPITDIDEGHILNMREPEID